MLAPPVSLLSMRQLRRKSWKARLKAATLSALQAEIDCYALSAYSHTPFWSFTATTVVPRLTIEAEAATDIPWRAPAAQPPLGVLDADVEPEEYPAIKHSQQK